MYRLLVVTAHLLRQSWTCWRDYWEELSHRQTKVSLSLLPPLVPLFPLFPPSLLPPTVSVEVYMYNTIRANRPYLLVYIRNRGLLQSPYIMSHFFFSLVLTRFLQTQVIPTE